MKDMALGIIILSTEGGKQTATMLAADKEEVKELAETFTIPACKFINVGNEAETAMQYYCRAWEVIGNRWEAYNAKDSNA
jgi:hypothetical protein